MFKSLQHKKKVSNLDIHIDYNKGIFKHCGKKTL
jgi:hypothetical protein